MAETTLEYLKKQLDSETQSTGIVHLPSDFYSRLATYNQKLRRSAAAGASDATVRLIELQRKMVESMAKDLLTLRAKKAAQQNAFVQLLPEERFVCEAEQRFQRRFATFVEAVSLGQPSYIEFAHRRESERNVTVRFTKRVNELVGLDLRRYGPFDPDDVASIPAENADILIAGGDAVEIYTREES